MSQASSFRLFDGVIPVASSYSSRLMMLIFAIVITGIGASLTVGMKIVPNPADGLASVLEKSVIKDLVLVRISLMVFLLSFHLL